jgi:hypothetical protein
MNAAFGSVSTGGIGTPELDVPQTGGAPCAFVAIQPGGKMGGMTLSKFSLNTTGRKQGGEHEGIGGGVGVVESGVSAFDESAITNIVASKRVNLSTALHEFIVLFPFFLGVSIVTFFSHPYQTASRTCCSERHQPAYKSSGKSLDTVNRS